MQSLSKIESMQDHGIGVIMNDIESVSQMSKKLMQTKHYQKMGEDGIFAICMAARSNGISVADALNGELYYVQGRVGMGYEAMNKYIRLAGHSVMIKHLDDKSCTLIGKRKDTGDTAEITFDMNDAKRAGKTYDKHPKPMLFARALSMLKRFLFPDVLTKIYEKGELDDVTFDTQISDFKPIILEENKQVISAAQAVELSELLSRCDTNVKDESLSYIMQKFNIELIDDLPASEFDRCNKWLKGMAEKNPKKPVEDIIVNAITN